MSEQVRAARITVRALAALVAIPQMAGCASAVPEQSVGRVIYLAVAAPGGGDGSEQAPYRDPQAALDRLQPGDTLLVREGVYPGGLEVRVPGEPGRPITIAAYPGERPRIHARHVYGFLLGCGIHDVVIRGFEIHDFSVDHAGGFEAHGMAHAAGIMGRCEDLAGEAVSDSAFLDNVIHGSRDGEGIWLRLSPRNIVAGNVLYDLGSSGIRFKHSEGCTAFSNLVYDAGFTDGLGGGITFYCAPDTVVSYNTVAMTDAPEAPAILAYDGTSPESCVASDRAAVHHNIGVRVGERSAVLADALNVQHKNATTAIDLDIHDDIWWTAGRWTRLEPRPGCPTADRRDAPVVLWGSDIVYQEGCWLPVPAYQELTGQGAGDRQVDPLFVDVSARDFRLSEGSPARDRATPTSREESWLEMLGLPIPAAGTMDLGFQLPDEVSR